MTAFEAVQSSKRTDYKFEVKWGFPGFPSAASLRMGSELVLKGPPGPGEVDEKFEVSFALHAFRSSQGTRETLTLVLSP